MEGDGQLITRFATRKTASLLAFLAFHRLRPQARDVLIDLLWPDAPPPSARNSLSKALSALRRVLEPKLKGADEKESTGLHGHCMRKA